MKLTPHTIPNALALRDQLAQQYTELRVMTLALGEENVGAPREIIQQLYTALEQFRHLNKNVAKAVSGLVSLEQDQQKAHHLATLAQELPAFSYRLEVDGEVELDDTTEDRAREAYVRFDMDKRKVRLYLRPVTSTDPKGWETIDWNFDLDSK